MANFKIKKRAEPPSPLVRPRPKESSDFVVFASPTDGFGVYIHCGVLDFIERQSRRAAPNEAIGLLAGRICHDLERVPYTLVMAAEGAVSDEAEAGPGHVHISPDGRARVRRRLEAAHPDREIVGWYHSHPHHEPRFSSVDAKEQSAWSDPNQVGIVFSATERDEPFGVYRGPGAVRLSRRPDSQSAAAVQTAFTAKKAEIERVALERTQRDVARLPGVSVAPARRVRPPWRAPSRMPPGTARRLIALLLVLGLTAGIIWLHMRVRSIEKTLGGAKNFVLSSPAQAAPSETPQQSSQPPATGTQAAGQELDANSGSQTALTNEPPLNTVANPLNGKAVRRERKLAIRNREPKAGAKKIKNSNQ